MRLTKRQKRRLFALLIALILVGAQKLGWYTPPYQFAGATQPGYYQVIDFADGDTLTVDMNGARETIRLIGVDTPETHDPRKAVQCFGKAAANFTQNLIGSQIVRLEADQLNTNRDRYNRLLRYVYLPDNTLVNAEIIKQGYGFAYTSFPFAKRDDFRSLEQEARDNGRGLWSSCRPQLNEYGTYSSNDE